MLQTIREHTQGWIAGIIISLIILSFALWGIHSYFVGGSSNTVVATVNGIEISREQLAVTYERLRRQVQAQYGSNLPISTKDETLLKDRALQALIEIEVLKQASIDQDFHISNRQVDNYLESMPEFQVNGQFSLERFHEVLASTLLSPSDLLDLIKTSLLVAQPKLGLVLTSFALPEEINYTIALVNQERDIQYLTIPQQYVANKRNTISADKVTAYYNQHQEEFKTPEQVSVDYVELSMKDMMASIHPTDADLEKFYKENINSYSQPMAWQIADINLPVAANASPEAIKTAAAQAQNYVQALAHGENVTKLAGNFEEGSLRKAGWIQLGDVPAELQSDVAKLTHANQVVGPVRTSRGFTILIALGIRTPQIQSFASVKDKVNETLIHQQAEEKFANLREQLANITYEHPDSLQSAAKALNLPIQSSELFTQDKGGKDISTYKKVRDTAFSDDVLNMQNNSDVIQLNPENIIVLRVKTHLASALLPLRSVAKQIEDKLQSADANQQVAQLADEIKTKLQSGQDPNQLAKSYHLTWQSTGYLGRYSTKLNTAILELAFTLPRPAANKTSYGVTRLPDGYAIVALRGVKDGAVANKQQYTVFAEQVQNSEGVLEYELYKLSQINSAQIEISK